MMGFKLNPMLAPYPACNSYKSKEQSVSDESILITKQNISCCVKGSSTNTFQKINSWIAKLSSKRAGCINYDGDPTCFGASL